MVLTIICVPAHSEILVYNKTIKYWEAVEGTDWNVTSETIRGFLVLDVVYNEDGTINDITDAVQVEYGRNDARNKVYTETSHDFGIVRVVYRNRVQWVLVESDSNENGDELTLLRGSAIDSRIGNVDPNEIAKSLSGNRLGYWNDGGDEDVVVCEWTLRLKDDWTRWINEDEKTLGEALDDIELWLEAKGYNPEV